MRLLFTLTLLAATLPPAPLLPLACGFAIGRPPTSSTAPTDIPSALADVKAIAREGEHGPQAAHAARRIAALPPESLPAILAGFQDANPLAANLLRSAFESIADRAADAGAALPRRRLEAFILQSQQDPRARRLAYELVRKVDPSIKERLIPGMLTDASPDFRRDAAAYWIAEAERLESAGPHDDALSAYRRALTGAIHDDQVQTIVKALGRYGVAVDLPHHFGFVTDWKAIGPFDNRGGKGFNAVYPPERGLDFDATYDGQLGKVRWQPLSTQHDYGLVDVAKQVQNYKGSAMYLAAEFESPRDQPVEFRLGTQNAWKLWLNDEFLFGREEYHRGMIMDQHRVPATLRSGTNRILLKLLQNEQPEDWAQSYSVQLRITDPSGRAIQPQGK